MQMIVLFLMKNIIANPHLYLAKKCTALNRNKNNMTTLTLLVTNSIFLKPMTHAELISTISKLKNKAGVIGGIHLNVIKTHNIDNFIEAFQ